MIRRSFLCLALIVVSFVSGHAAEGLPDPCVPAIPTAPYTKTAWPARHQAKLAEKSSRKIDLVFLGDSITECWEKKGKQGGTEAWQTYYAKRNALNLGFSGDRTEHVLWRLQHGEIDRISPKVLVLMIGTNNTGQLDGKQPATATAAGVKAILNEIRTRCPQTKILLLGVLPRSEKGSDALRLHNDQVNDLIKEFGKLPQVTYLDIGSHFLRSQGDGKTLNTGLMPDKLHPWRDGYFVIAKAIEPTLAALLGDTPVSAPAPNP